MPVLLPRAQQHGWKRLLIDCVWEALHDQWTLIACPSTLQHVRSWCTLSLLLLQIHTFWHMAMQSPGSSRASRKDEAIGTKALQTDPWDRRTCVSRQIPESSLYTAPALPCTPST